MGPTLDQPGDMEKSGLRVITQNMAPWSSASRAQTRAHRSVAVAVMRTLLPPVVRTTAPLGDC